METQISILVHSGQTNQQKAILLIPLAMRVPNEAGVYGLSLYSPFRVVTQQEFEQYQSKFIRIGTPERSDIVTAWAFGLRCWYLAMTAPDTLTPGDYHPPIDRCGFDIISLIPQALSYRWDWAE